MTTATQCNHCGTVSNNHLPGDGCHSCLAGVMVKLQVCENSITLKTIIDPDTGRSLIAIPTEE